MKIIINSKRHHYVARISIFLVVVALIVGIAGCVPGNRYSLSILSTEGGSVTKPGEGVFPFYSEGRVVNLVATPDSGYQFDKWTGDVSTIADVEDATTTITMLGSYAITANFVP